jgi:guanosine-3',5'-bis(diphosphate) 3'-pyrophosphohydrolase
LTRHAGWQQAASYAARQHAGQVRKDRRTPYVAHPFRVAMTLRHVFEHDDEATLAAAVLHDTIEDTTSDYDEIERLFGHEVARLVACMSKNMLLPEAEREAEYDGRLREGDWRARLIKLADAYDNLHDLRHRVVRSPGGYARNLERHLRRCERALALAEPDAPDHPETARAIDALRSAMADAQRAEPPESAG